METSRADLHVHSTASAVSKLGVQRALGLPECATPPEEAYALAKRRGMAFVTLTDHDTIDGALELHEAHPGDTFVSVELTARFRDEPQAVHVLCWGITPDDHARLQERAHDVEQVAAHLHEQGIACALAHPFFAVGAPLLPRHRRRLAQLLPVWEVRNGSRAPELNLPAATYIETHGGTGVGGSDDHAGVDVGRTWTEVPACATPEELLAHVRAGAARPRGEQGSAAKWAHAAMAIAVRTLGPGDAACDPRAVLTMARRVLVDGDARSGALATDLEPDDARGLLHAWLRAIDLGELDAAQLLCILQADDFRHAALERRARRVHERKLGVAARTVQAAVQAHEPPPLDALFEACVAAIPYAPSAALLAREKRKLAPPRDAEPHRVALVADGIGGTHGVTRTLQELRDRGVPGFDVEVVGTDPDVDRRLPSVADLDVPFYPGLQVGVPSLPGLVEALADGRYDLVHVVSPGPAGVAAALLARTTGLPLVGSFHTELGAYAELRGAGTATTRAVELALATFYGACDHVLSPSPQSDALLERLGIEPARLGRWDRGVDLGRFGPHRRTRTPDGRLQVLYAGRLTREKGADLLAEAFLRARAQDPRLHLVLAGGGPEEEALLEAVGPHVTSMGWLHGDDLARAYADADVFLFASRTDTFGQVVLEAQASGLPVVAVAEGGPLSLVRDGETGLLRAAGADALAGAVLDLAADPARRGRLAARALAEVRSRTWEASMGRLGVGWLRALSAAAGGRQERRAA